MFIDMLGEAMINSDMPEERKINIRVLMAVKRVKDLMADKAEKLCHHDVESTPELFAKQKEALVLLESIYDMLKGFDETVTENKETNEIKD